jgi:hypothetical protein
MSEERTIADREKAANLPLIEGLTRESGAMRKDYDFDVGEGMKTLRHWPTGIHLNF